MNQEVNLNDPRLQAMLGRSKQVMQESEARYPDKRMKINNAPAQTGGQQVYEEREPPMPQMMTRRRDEPMDPNSPEYRARLQSSKLPANIKQAMMENNFIDEPYQPINEVYSAQQIQQQFEPQVQQPVRQAPRPQQMAQGFTREEMKVMIKECLSELMMENITENAIKTNLRKMMNEGKLKVKK